MRVLGGAAAVAAVVLALTGCGSQAAPSTYTPTVTVVATSTPTSSSSPSRTAAPSTAAAPATSAAADPDRPEGQCTDSALGVSVRDDPAGSGAGSRSSEVLFTNTGGETCTLRGVPGVSVVGGDGTRIGPAADRADGAIATLTLQPGGTVRAPLRLTNIGTDGGPLDGCTVRKGEGYRVHPPHSTTAFLVRDADAAGCTDGPVFMTVGAVVPQ